MGCERVPEDVRAYVLGDAGRYRALLYYPVHASYGEPPAPRIDEKLIASGLHVEPVGEVFLYGLRRPGAYRHLPFLSSLAEDFNRHAGEVNIPDVGPGELAYPEAARIQELQYGAVPGVKGAVSRHRIEELYDLVDREKRREPLFAPRRRDELGEV